MRIEKYQQLIQGFLRERLEKLSHLAHRVRNPKRTSAQDRAIFEEGYKKGYWHGAADSMRTVEVLTAGEGDLGTPIGYLS